MKKISLLFIFLIVLPFSLIVSANDDFNFCDFSDSKKIIVIEELRDFSGNSFKLYELENGYAIYSIKENIEIFIEGSYESNSPYYTFLNKNQLYYLGPGNYYYLEENKVKNILNNEYYHLNDISFSYELPTVISTFNTSSIPNENQTLIDSNGFIQIKYGEYFNKLRDFPFNYFKDCGLVALSILLGYLDTFYNDDFLPDDVTATAKHYKVVNGTYVLDYKREEYLVSKVREKYVEDDTYDLTRWSQVPGTTQGLKDYLFDNYLHTFFIGDDDNGYPMFNGELKDTMHDYMKDNCPHLLNSVRISDGQIINTHKNTKQLLDNGIPVILVLTSNSESKGIKYKKVHQVVAYGYKDDKFLVHSGWYGDNAIILSEASIYGYYALEYIGEHVHSKNLNMVSGHTLRYVCGCGYIQNDNQHIYYAKSYNFKQHRYSCSCGSEYFENHSFITINEGVIGDEAIPKISRCSICGYQKPF